MKLRELSEKVFNHLIKEYHKSGETMFRFEDLQSAFGDVEPEQLDLALVNLKRKGYLNLQPADDKEAFHSWLTTFGIEAGEANTFFEKFTVFLKVLKILLDL